MTLAQIDTVKKAWPTVAQTIRMAHTQEEYQGLVEFLDHLIDEVGENESHPLASLMEVVGILVEKYEDEHVPDLQ